MALVTAVVVSGCAAGSGTVATVRPASPEPSRSVSAAVALTRAELVRVLGTRNLVLADAQVPFRPPEGPGFAAAPRDVFQVVLPDDPTEGYIVVYDFVDAATAAEAGVAEAAYLASGPGRVQSAEGTRHILRQVGSTIVSYSWAPAGAEDPRAPNIQAALETLGAGIDIPG